VIAAAVVAMSSAGGAAWTHQAQRATVVRFASTGELRQAVLAARPGTRIVIAPGEYQGGLFFENIRGNPVGPS
jgi:hypothetical protein